MKPTSTKSKSNKSPYTSNKNNTSSPNKNRHSQKISNDETEIRQFDSKNRNASSPHKSEKAKDPFIFPAVEKRYIIDDDDNNVEYTYDYEYESTIDDKKSIPQKNKAQPKNKNSPKKQMPKKNTRNIPLSPRKREIVQQISKLEAELRDLQSSVISGMTNENSESMNELTQKIDAKKRRLNELERMAEIEKLQQKEQNDKEELRRRIEILERNQEELLSPKPRPNLGFMSPNDAIISIQAKPFEQPEEGSSLIERRNQAPLNVDVPNKKTGNKQQEKKDEPQVQEREVSLSSERKLNESSFCKLNPRDAKEFADKHLKNIVTSNSKENSSQPKPRSSHSTNQKSLRSQKEQNKTPESNFHFIHSSNKQNESPKIKPKSQTPIKQQQKQDKPTVTTRTIDLNRQENNQDYDNLSVDVTIVDVRKIPDVSAYCVIYTEATNRSPNKTKVSKRGTESNVFNESFHFEFSQLVPKSSVLVILIKKEDLIKGDKLIGSVKIDLNAVIRSMNKKKVNALDKAFPIISDSKVQTEGRLHLILKSDCANNAHINKFEPEKKTKKAPKKIENPANSIENKAENSQENIPLNDDNNNNVIERNQEIELESTNEQKNPPKVQPNLKSSIVSLLSSQSSKASLPQNQVANPPKDESKNEKQERLPRRKTNTDTNANTNKNTNANNNTNTNNNTNANTNINTNTNDINANTNRNAKKVAKQKPKENINNIKSPKSPKYNWNTVSLPKTNKKKPIYEIISEDEEQNKQDDSDEFDETAPSLNPSSFPLPKIKYTPSVEGEILRENEIRTQLDQSLQDILEQTGSPVRTREVDFEIENDTFFEEEEEEIDLNSDLPLETVSEDEDQIINKLDKTFGKEPPRLSSAGQSEVEFSFNNSDDAVTYNLANISKYYQPRFINDDVAKRRTERKRRQQFLESQHINERDIDLESSLSIEGDENTDFQNNSSSKKRPRITKVSNTNESIDSLVNSEPDEQIAILPISDDDDSENNNNEIVEPNVVTKESNLVSNNNSAGLLQETSSSEEEEKPKREEEKPKREEEEKIDDSSSIASMELDLFISNNTKKPSSKVDDKINNIEKVESEKSPNEIMFNNSNSDKKMSASNTQASIPTNSSLISIGETSSFSECSIKSSFEQFNFIESVKKLSKSNEVNIVKEDSD